MASTTKKTASAKPAPKTAVTKASAAKPAAKAAPVVAKAQAKPAAKKQPPAQKATAAKTPASGAVAKSAPKRKSAISDEQRYRMVAEAAYYRAESNQFKSDPVRDWIEAESDIAALLNSSR